MNFQTEVYKIQLIIILLLSCMYVQANTQDGAHLFFTGRFDHGAVLKTNDFVRGVNKEQYELKEYRAVNIGFGNQTSGKRDWEHIYNFPAYGVGVHTLFFDYGDEFGHPVGVYGFFHGPFHRWNRSALTYRIEFGAAFNWKAYDSITNPYNIVIGSGTTVHIGLGMAYNYWIADRWEISAGIGATHFSNGAYKRPNKGLNLFSANLSLNYNLKPKPEFVKKTIPAYHKHNEIVFNAGYGIKSPNEHNLYNCEYPEVYFNAITFSASYMRQYSHKCKSGGGAILIYDDWVGSTLQWDGTGNVEKKHGKTSRRFSLGLFAAHELCIDRLSIPLNLGCYVWQGLDGAKSKIFQRVGIKYHFKNDMFAGVNVYAHRFSKADFIEWNLGYRIKWGKNKRN